MIWILGGETGTANSNLIRPRGACLLKILIAINFVILLVLISPVGTSHELYKAYRESALLQGVTTFIQIWVVASTIVATVLFGFMLWKAHRAGLSVRSLRFEGILLLAWWVTILAACA